MCAQSPMAKTDGSTTAAQARSTTTPNDAWSPALSASSVARRDSAREHQEVAGDVLAVGGEQAVEPGSPSSSVWNSTVSARLCAKIDTPRPVDRSCAAPKPRAAVEIARHRVAARGGPRRRRRRRAPRRGRIRDRARPRRAPRSAGRSRRRAAMRVRVVDIAQGGHAPRKHVIVAGDAVPGVRGTPTRVGTLAREPVASTSRS